MVEAIDPGCNTKAALDVEVEQLLLLAAKAKDEYLWQSIMILLRTGMHISCLLRPSDHNLVVGTGYITWKRAKTSTQVRLPIHPDIREFVGPFFVWAYNNPRSNMWFFRRLKVVATGIGHPEISALTFRHTYCRWCFRQGLDIYLVMRCMGVTSIETLSTYAEAIEKEREERIRKAFGGGGEQ